MCSDKSLLNAVRSELSGVEMPCLRRLIGYLFGPLILSDPSIQIVKCQ